MIRQFSLLDGPKWDRGKFGRTVATKPTDVTALLHRLNRGDTAAFDQLMPLVYRQLRRQAALLMRGERSDHTLQPTALINEAFLRLVDQTDVRWQNRAHFLAVAAQAMRRVLVDHARARLRAKRGAGAQRVELDDLGQAPVMASPEDVLDLHQALHALAEIDPQQGRVVELRYFGGLTIEETAQVLDISPATVKREWTMAKAWLRSHIVASHPSEERDREK